MKKLILAAAIALSVVSCSAQQQVTDSVSKGYTVGYVIEITDQGAMINARGRSIIAKNITSESDMVDAGVEYDMVYEIIERRDKALIVILVAAEYSAEEGAKRRARLRQLIH